MRKLLFVLLPVLFFSQKRELGKVTIEELKETSFAKDTSAVAKVLIDRGTVSFEYASEIGLIMVVEVEQKIKIYKKEGFHFATYAHRYEDKESVSFSKAATYNLVNGKVEKTKLNSDGEFKEVISKDKDIKARKIVLPNVKEGSIIEFKYEYRTPYFRSLTPWKFQSLIPVEFSELKTIVPHYLSYKSYKRGSKEIKTTSETYGGTISMRSGSVNVNNTVSVFTVNDIPAFKIEPYSNDIENYLSGIEFELSTTQYPNSDIKYLSTSWEDVTSTIYKNDYFGTELNKESYFEDDLNIILAKKFDDDNHKIRTILEFVKSKVKWDDYVGIYTDKGVRYAYKNGTGNSTEINFILIAMLKKAGIDANPVLISTRNKPINLFPSIAAFNKVICGIEVENDVLFLDATEKFTTIDVLPQADLNYFGRIIRKNGSSADVNLSPKKFSITNNQMISKINPDGKIEGEYRRSSSEYLGQLKREKINSKNQEQYLEYLEKKSEGIEIEEAKTENKNDIHLPFVEQFKFTSANHVEIVGNKMLLKPFMFETQDENPFKQDKREYIVDFIYPIQEKCMFTYNLPQGYTVESKPEDINLQTEDGACSFKVSTMVKDNSTFQLVSTFSISSTIVTPENYISLKTFFNEMVKKMNEKLILKKN